MTRQTIYVGAIALYCAALFIAQGVVLAQDIASNLSF